MINIDKIPPNSNMEQLIEKLNSILTKLEMDINIELGRKKDEE